MLSNLAFSKVHHPNVESPSPEKKSPDKNLLASKSKNILTVSYCQNSPEQLQPMVGGTASIFKEAKPLYIDERDDDDTVSVLSDGDGLLLDTNFSYNENENSGPSCTFGSENLRQEQQYIGGNYFFRQNTSAAENDCHDVVSFPSEDQNDQHSMEETAKGCSSLLPKSSSPDRNNPEDLRRLVETLQQEKSALSQKCSELETVVLEAQHDHNCYKAKMTMAMGSLQIQMESERDDKSYLLDKCQHLKKELQALRTDYDSKLGIISVLENQLHNSPSTFVGSGNETVPIAIENALERS